MSAQCRPQGRGAAGVGKQATAERELLRGTVGGLGNLRGDVATQVPTPAGRFVDLEIED